MPKALRSLRSRITIVSTVVLFIVLALASVLIVNLVERQLSDELTAQNQETLDRLSADIAAGIDPRLLTLPLASDGTEFNISTPEGMYVNSTFAAFDAGFIEFFEGEELPDDIISFEALFEDQFPGRDPDEFAPDFVTNGLPLPEVFEIFLEDQAFWDSMQVSTAAPDGTVYLVEAFSPVAVVDRSVNQVRSVLWLVIPALAGVFAALVWFVTGRALRPVDEITSRAGRIGSETLHQRIDEPGTDDEIDRLAITLNGMLDRLERGATAQKQFVSDASHELQTPLTVMLGEAQLAAGTDDPQRLADANHRIIEQGEKMRVLIHDLLELARSGEVGLHHADVDLDDVIRGAASNLEAPVDTRALSPTRLTGDASSLRRLFENLLQNASRYGNGRIVISSSIDDATDHVVVHIDDDGPGVPPAERLQIFERFVRLDESRTRSTGGTGLGLAICKAIVTAHHGALGVGDSPLGGARFEVRLPLTPAASGGGSAT